MSDSRPEARLLMVDGSRFACLRVAAILADTPGVDFHYATTPDAALALAARVKPTALLCSSSPELSSTFVERLRVVTDGAPILLLDEGGAGSVDVFADRETLLERLAALDPHVRASGSASADGLPVATAAAAADARVFLVDDSQVVCRAIEEQISTRAGIAFQSCLDPTQALARAVRFHPTVILLDLEMPKISGFELLTRLRADPQMASVPIIVLSGIEDVGAKVRAFRLGANDYAEKTMERVELMSRIAYHSHAYRTAERLNRSVAELTAAKRRLERQGTFLRRTFGRYLSDEIVDSILETPEGLELGGEKRVVTAMMSDLRNFTPLGEKLAPQDLLVLLNNYLSAMTDVLMAHAGTIDEFIGDAILAVFGAPIFREDDATRAVACAVAMQLAMADVNTWNRQRGYPELAMGIGINTGEVVVGNIGSERRAKYGIVGAHVNLTARIESYTGAGEIFISEETLEACHADVRVDSEREVLPKGFSKPITIYEIGGIGGAYQLFLPKPSSA